jgi:hypothetical protein
MILINFAHALSESDVEAVGRLASQTVTEVINVKSQFDETQSFAEQAKALVEASGLKPEQWQTEQLLINLPSYNYAAALVIAELHGRTGYFPSVLRLRSVAGGTTPRFEVAEILNLQAARETARGRR